MNKTNSHPTDHTCNVCGGDVVDDYGNVRCGDITCLARDRTNDLSWDSDEEEIAECRRDNVSYTGPAA